MSELSSIVISTFPSTKILSTGVNTISAENSPAGISITPIEGVTVYLVGSEEVIVKLTVIPDFLK